ncbi:MAG: phosphoribosylglycinamide formyltransferase [Rikenellaceae bacterium]|nr:phosphoribosylglycinamide formyltransferase [Rikenellaceae bacterium]
MKNIAIFASGSGSNAENIINYFKNSGTANVCTVFCNKKGAYVITRAQNLGVDSVIFDRKDLYENGKVMEELEDRKVDYIVLAGFLWLIPEILVKKYENKIINIHPALLPAYGGKGMYGDNVHKAVVANGEKKSGITIHLVNSIYDSGDIIFQAETEVAPEDDYKAVAQKIHKLEGEHFPRVIEEHIKSLDKK